MKRISALKKKCKDCKKLLPMSRFGRVAKKYLRKRDTSVTITVYLLAHCRRCANIRTVSWAKKHRPATNKTQRLWRDRNRTEVNRKQRLYFKQHGWKYRARQLVYQRGWRAKNRDRCRAYNRKRWRERPELKASKVQAQMRAAKHLAGAFIRQYIKTRLSRTLRRSVRGLRIPESLVQAERMRLQLVRALKGKRNENGRQCEG